MYSYNHSHGAWNAPQNVSALAASGRTGDALVYAEMRSRVWMQSFLVWCLVFLSLGMSSKLTSPWQRMKHGSYCCCRYAGRLKKKGRGMLEEEDDFGDANEYTLPKHHICNHTWVFASALLLAAQACACAVTERSPARAPPTGLIVFVAVWPFVILAVDDLVKRSDMKRIKKINQRLRIMFDTKLGMYSPR